MHVTTHSWGQVTRPPSSLQANIQSATVAEKHRPFGWQGVNVCVRAYMHVCVCVCVCVCVHAHAHMPLDLVVSEANIMSLKHFCFHLIIIIALII